MSRNTVHIVSTARPAIRARRGTAAATAAIVVLAALWAPVGARAQEQPTVVVLVRHAEKEPRGNDPALTAEGRARAALLAETLKDSGITAIFTTATRRAQETAAPVAAALHVTPAEMVKDASHLRAQVLAAGGRVLIVGHSNTVPGLIAALGGPPDVTIADNSFDGLFVLTIPPHGPSTLLTLRYGAPPKAGAARTM